MLVFDKSAVIGGELALFGENLSHKGLSTGSSEAR